MTDPSKYPTWEATWQMTGRAAVVAADELEVQGIIGKMIPTDLAAVSIIDHTQLIATRKTEEPT